MSHVPTCMSHWHMNQWCRHHQMVRMSHVTHMDKSWVMWHIWIRPVLCMNGPCHTYELLMSHIHGLCHTYMGYVTHTWVMSHIRMRHVMCMDESCVTYRWVMSHRWISHVTHIEIARRAHVWMVYVTHMCVTHTCMWHQSWHIRHVTHMDESESRDAYGCVTSHVWMCHTHERMMSHTWMSDVILRWVMWSSCQIHQLLPDPWHAWVTSHTWMSHVTHVIYSGLPV